MSKIYPTLVQHVNVTHSHVSSLSGVEHTYLVQKKNGLEIVNALASIHVDKNGDLIKFNQYLHPYLVNQDVSTNPQIDVIKAIENLAIDLEIDISTENTKILNNDIETNIIELKNTKLSSEKIIARKAYYLFGKKLQLIWQLNVQTQHDWWDARINATSGEVIEKINWVTHCNFDHHGNINSEYSHKCNHNHSALIPNSYHVWKLGIESPNHGSRTQETLPHNTLASPYGWHDTNGVIGPEHTKTKGNNVEAKEDIAADNETTIGSFAEGGPNLDFDFPFTQNTSALTNLNLSITNIFYWSNIIHDVIYQYGFDEAAGNFQLNNYGRGGLGNDFVYADALDGSGTNNANFATPKDGINPRMQMFRWLYQNTFSINPPSPLAGNINAVKANFGPVSYDITADLKLADPILACTTPLNNLTGHIAIIDRGSCEFSTKVLNAQNAGAIAALVCQNSPQAPFAMGPGTNGSSVTIPALMISQADCNNIKAELNNGQTVNMTLKIKEHDSGFDNGIIIHEYGHGISNRLTGGAGNSSCLSGQEQMGEGWSDWYGLMLTMAPTSVGSTGRGIGTFVLNQPTTGNGIRQYKYSTDLSVNPHTYNSIINAAAPHGVGSVWCAMLWEMTWLLINKYGYNPDLYNGNGGNNKALALVTEALKLQPCRPGFVDGRDAILLADQILYNGENQCLIWQAFAKRGLGYNAKQGSSSSKTDGEENFDLPPFCSKILVSMTTPYKYASQGDTVFYEIKVKNLSNDPLNNIALTDTLSRLLSFTSASNGGTINNGVVSYPLFNLAANDSIVRQLNTLYNYPDLMIPSIIENADSNYYKVSSTRTNNLLDGWIKSTSSYSGSFAWFAKNETTPIEKYLTFKYSVRPTATSTLEFWHRYDTEVNWDGGNVEISTDNKLTWQDLGPLMTLNGYNGYLNNLPAQPAFSGNSGGYINTIVNLSTFKNKDVFIRFKFMCDPADGGDGWYIDNIKLTNIYPTITNVVSQSNTNTASTSISSYPPIKAASNKLIYTNEDNGRGSLRKAASIALNGDTLYLAPEIYGDTIKLTSSVINFNNNLLIKNPDSTAINIESFHTGSVLSINNGKVLELFNVNIFKKNSSTDPVILNNGTLILDSGTYKIDAMSNGLVIKNETGSDLIIRRNVAIKRE